MLKDVDNVQLNRLSANDLPMISFNCFNPLCTRQNTVHKDLLAAGLQDGIIVCWYCMDVHNYSVLNEIDIHELQARYFEIYSIDPSDIMKSIDKLD